MSLPETCPFCAWVGFECHTSIHAGQDVRRTQSRTCEGLERTRLADRIVALEADAKQARDDEAWAKQNLVYVSVSPEGCWAGMYDADAHVEHCETIAAAISALRDMVEGGAR